MVKNKDISSYNSKGQRHGYWEIYYMGDTLEYNGHYKNDKCVGLWKGYNRDGTLWYKEYYSYLGNIEGISITKQHD